MRAYKIYALLAAVSTGKKQKLVLLRNRGVVENKKINCLHAVIIIKGTLTESW